MNTSAIERVAAVSAPARLQIEEDPTREERSWIVRLASEFVGTDDAGGLAGQLAAAAQHAVREARIARQPIQANEESEVSVRIGRIDGQHLIVTIATIRLEEDEAHTWLVAASAALRRLHEAVALEELQGIPIRFWKLVVGPQ